MSKKKETAEIKARVDRDHDPILRTPGENRALEALNEAREEIQRLNGHLRDAWKNVEFERRQLEDCRTQMEHWRELHDAVRSLRNQRMLGKFDNDTVLKRNLKVILESFTFI